MIERAGRLLAVLLLVAGCAPSLPESYQRSRAAAERAYAAGRYEEAAAHWSEAADQAERPRDRAEARYRTAASLERAGRHAEAARMLATLQREMPKSERAARAAYDQADIEIESGDPEKGYQMLEQVIVDYPSSGVAKSAIGRHVSWQQEKAGSDRVLAWIAGLRPRLKGTPAAEQLEYVYAGQLEKAGRARAARNHYLWLADRYPYPQGAYWDDALWHASLIDEELGDYRAAIADLERMLREQEPSSLQGSYQRQRFGEARYRIAELCRDRLGDEERARRVFHQVWTDHPTSLRRDDALWNEAILAKKAHDGAAACRALELLASGMPDSRYVPCAPVLCESMSAPEGTRCHDYIRRGVESGAGAER